MRRLVGGGLAPGDDDFGNVTDPAVVVCGFGGNDVISTRGAFLGTFIGGDGNDTVTEHGGTFVGGALPHRMCTSDRRPGPAADLMTRLQGQHEVRQLKFRGARAYRTRLESRPPLDVIAHSAG